MSAGSEKDYTFTAKNKWRQAQWRYIASRIPMRRRKTSKIIILLGPGDSDLFWARVNKFPLANIVCVEKDYFVAKRNRKKVMTVKGELGDVLECWDGVPFSVVIADFCGSFSNKAARFAEVLETSKAISNRAVVCVNLMRGREPVVYKKEEMLHRGEKFVDFLKERRAVQFQYDYRVVTAVSYKNYTSDRGPKMDSCFFQFHMFNDLPQKYQDYELNRQMEFIEKHKLHQVGDKALPGAGVILAAIAAMSLPSSYSLKKRKSKPSEPRASKTKTGDLWKDAFLATRKDMEQLEREDKAKEKRLEKKMRATKQSIAAAKAVHSRTH